MTSWATTSTYLPSNSEKTHGFWSTHQIRATITPAGTVVWLGNQISQWIVLLKSPQSMQVSLLILSNNCHHHVADVLNCVQYKGKTNWNQVDIWWMCIWSSSYVNKCYVMKVYCPFVVMALFVAFIIATIRATWYLSILKKARFSYKKRDWRREGYIA